ncbi:MAG: ribokinase [Caulobacterales bacterium]
MGPAEIVVIGSYNRDVSLVVAHLPAPGETCLSLGRLESPGGKGSNQAIQAARCGAATAMIAALGDDGAGEEALALWAADGIATDRVVRLQGQGTGMAMILVDAAGENVIVVDSGANALLSPAHAEAAADLIGGAKLILAQLETPAAATLRAFEIARAAGAATLLNAAPAPEAIDPALLALTDILIVNEGEGRALSGHDHAAAIGEALLAKVAKAVVVTMGAKGAMLFEHHRPPHAAAPPPVEVVDTTGAGDAFTGAFAARWAATGEAMAALAWGLAAGALACTLPGAAASCPGAAQIAALV